MSNIVSNAVIYISSTGCIYKDHASVLDQASCQESIGGFSQQGPQTKSSPEKRLDAHGSKDFIQLINYTYTSRLCAHFVYTIFGYKNFLYMYMQFIQK